MKDNFKKKIIAFFDSKDANIPPSFYVSISVICFIISSIIGFNAIMAILICLTIIVAFGAILQIVKKNKNKRNIITYSLVTIILIIIIRISWLMQYYTKIGNINFFDNLIKITLIFIVLVIDILCIINLFKRNHSRNKKILLILVMFYITIIAVLALIFL